MERIIHKMSQQRMNVSPTASAAGQKNDLDHYPKQSVMALSALCAALMLNGGAHAQSANELTSKSTPAKAQAKKVAHATKKTPRVRVKSVATPAAPAPGLSPAEQATAAALAASPARFDKVYGYKGWDNHFPSYGDTLLQDYGGFRSTLAKYGFGFIEYNVSLFLNNMLDVPTSGPGPGNATLSNPNASASRQEYGGQRPLFVNVSAAYLTYDTSQFGVPDGQLAVSLNYSYGTWQHYIADKLSLYGLAWYQTLFDKKVEVKFGFIGNANEFIGTYVGGNFASPFGPSNTIPFLMGLSQGPANQPTARVTWHMTDTIYNEFAIARSLGIDGPSNDVFFDDVHYNPSGTEFSVPNGRVLLIDEMGYKEAAAPGTPNTWIRFGDIYNTSRFANYEQRLATGPGGFGTSDGSSAMYFLADRQFLQIAPDSIFTAYRGIYGGISAMYAPPQNAAFSQYYEARLYALGFFDSRPKDQISLVYSHNVFSHYVADYTNSTVPEQLLAQKLGLLNVVEYAHHASNSVTLSYTAHLMPGLYCTLGLNYTDHPSVTYVKGDGSDLGIEGAIVTVF